MSPAATKRRPSTSDTPTTTTMDAMAEAIARQRSDDQAVRQRHLDAYRRAVDLEAKWEPIPSEVADAALSAASALGIPPGRLAVDALALREADRLDARERELKSAMEEWRVNKAAMDARYAELKAEIHRLDALSVRPLAFANETVGISDARRILRERSPHLFAPAADLTSAEWNHIRTEV